MRIVEYRDSWLRPSVKPSEGFGLNWQISWIFQMVFFLFFLLFFFKNIIKVVCVYAISFSCLLHWVMGGSVVNEII